MQNAVSFSANALLLPSRWKVAESTVATLILPLLVLAVPILDTALVTAVRLVEGRPVHQGGRDPNDWSDATAGPGQNPDRPQPTPNTAAPPISRMSITEAA